MSESLPRWEWRTFGENVGAATLRMPGRQPTEIELSEEIYFVSGLCDVIVKIRNGQLDISRIEDEVRRGRPIAYPALTASQPSVMSRELSWQAIRHPRWR